MSKRSKIVAGVVAGVLLAAFAGISYVTRNEAHRLITAPLDEERNVPDETPADYGLPYEDVTVTSDGLKLAGWFVPSDNGAVIIMQHGYKSTRDELLNEAEMLHRHGYGPLITSIRAHDYSEGEMITFGMYEVDDLEAWYQYNLRFEFSLQTHGLDAPWGGAYSGPSGLQGLPQGGGLPAQRTGQVLVARAHRQAVRLTASRRDHDAHGEIQVARHALDNNGLLPVLGSKNGHVGQHDVKQFGDHSRHPAEMRRPRTTFHGARKPLLDNIRAVGVVCFAGVHPVVARRKHNVNASLSAQPQIPGKITRVAGKILAWAELGGVYVDAEDKIPPPGRGAPTELEAEEARDRERRRYVRTITDVLASGAGPYTVGRIALRRIAVAGAPGAAGATLAEAVRAIRRSTDRDRVADLVLDAIDRFLPACHAAILLVRRGDLAISWRGFSRGGHPIPELAVSLGPPFPAGLVLRAMEGQATTRAAARDLDAIEGVLLRSLGRDDGELAIVPISIGGEVTPAWDRCLMGCRWQ